MRKDPDVQTLSEIFFRIEEIRCPYYRVFCPFIKSLAAVISHICGNFIQCEWVEGVENKVNTCL